MAVSSVRLTIEPDQIVVEDMTRVDVEGANNASITTRRRTFNADALPQLIENLRVQSGAADANIKLDLFPHAGIWSYALGTNNVTGLWKVPLPQRVQLRDREITSWQPDLSLLMGGRWMGGVRLDMSWLYLAWGPVEGSAQEIRILPWPAGNVYEDAHICWGQVVINVPSPAHFPLIADMFFGSAFNNDLVVRIPEWTVDPSGQFRCNSPHAESSTVEALLRRLTGTRQR